MTIDVIDLFAGPGGLGEGFASLNNGTAFRVAVSAEMESSAHRTLTLRSYFRSAIATGDKRALAAYYAYCNSQDAGHPSETNALLWEKATEEARLLTLGETSSNQELDSILRAKKLDPDNTVLIGGPPCQAYSLVGRSRNIGKKDYVAEKDHRHFLYREYLRILSKAQPAVFLMENVKGMLSSRIGGKLVFQDILADLSDPAKATGRARGGRYTIYSLATDAKYESGMSPDELNLNSFIVRAEEYGIPQARHRVILLGIREDFAPQRHPLLTEQHPRSLRFALADLPKLRSRLSSDDSAQEWRSEILQRAAKFAAEAATNGDGMANALATNAVRLSGALSIGENRMPCDPARESTDSYLAWVRDKRLKVWLHHDSRSHMASDLGRYFYAAIFAQVWGRTPKGHTDFALPGLAPDHANWKSGKFADRFRVQQGHLPSSTITSHIAKDGHYFIHPDPLQCRSLTVREAARLQTFPDNYLFEGTRTARYHQVGNAVPPLLASQIAKVVLGVLRKKSSASVKRYNHQLAK